jgi:putative RecB family exonuclease
MTTSIAASPASDSAIGARAVGVGAVDANAVQVGAVGVGAVGVGGVQANAVQVGGVQVGGVEVGAVQVGADESGQVSDDPAPRPRRPLALSPSRASDFKTCPLLYRFRAVDRLPEPPSAPAARGTLVHSVLEQMFGRPPAERTPNRTAAQVGPAWEQLAGENPELLDLLPTADLAAWLESAQDLVRTYFTLEDPRHFDPEACEFAIEIESAGAVPMRGYLDRLDLAPTGQLRVVDYKTGRSPGPDFEAKALYQLKFYALMIYRLRGIVPAQLKLIYLADGLSLQYEPSEPELLAFETGVAALWSAITLALDTGNFPPRPSGMCQFCAHQALCPEFGGTPPPYPGMPGLSKAEADEPTTTGTT